MVDEIAADPGMHFPTEQKCQFDLRTDSVRAGDQQLVAAGRQPVNTAEMADWRRSRRSECRVRVRFDPFNRGGCLFDVDTRVVVR